MKKEMTTRSPFLTKAMCCVFVGGIVALASGCSTETGDTEADEANEADEGDVGTTQQAASFWSPNCVPRTHSKMEGLAVREYRYTGQTSHIVGGGCYTEIRYNYSVLHYTYGGPHNAGGTWCVARYFRHC